MTFVTKLTLQSGDRAALDRVVEDIRDLARRKGAELKGPHAESPTRHHVRQYERLDGDDTRRYDDWEYSVYTRWVEFVGSDTLPRRVLNEGFPDSVHVEVEVERQTAVGRA